MSLFAGRKRKGCSSCGKFTLHLDQARAEMRHATNRYAQHPTPVNRKAAEHAKKQLDEAKKFYKEHMFEHEDGDK